MWSKKRLLKKYKPENDKARKGGEECRAVEREQVGRGKPNTSTTVESNGRLEQPERRKLLPTANVSDDRKTSTSNREDGSSIRKLHRRRSRSS